MRVTDAYMNWTLSRNPLRSMVEGALKKYLPSELQAASFAKHSEQRMRDSKYRQPEKRERERGQGNGRINSD